MDERRWKTFVERHWCHAGPYIQLLIYAIIIVSGLNLVYSLLINIDYTLTIRCAPMFGVILAVTCVTAKLCAFLSHFTVRLNLRHPFRFLTLRLPRMPLRPVSICGKRFQPVEFLMLGMLIFAFGFIAGCAHYINNIWEADPARKTGALLGVGMLVGGTIFMTFSMLEREHNRAVEERRRALRLAREAEEREQM